MPELHIYPRRATLRPNTLVEFVSSYVNPLIPTCHKYVAEWVVTSLLTSHSRSAEGKSNYQSSSLWNTAYRHHGMLYIIIIICIRGKVRATVSIQCSFWIHRIRLNCATLCFRVGEDGKWNDIDGISTPNNESSYQVSGLKPYTVYSFRVLAVNAMGTSKPSKGSYFMITLREGKQHN